MAVDAWWPARVAFVPGRVHVFLARRAAQAVLACTALLAAGAALADSLGPRFCDLQKPLQAPQLDRLLRFAAIARQALQDTGASVALVSRSGTNLQRFGVRYSHAGISLRQGEAGPWSVRQLYYDCSEGRPQIFDQGLAGFVAGTDDPDSGYLAAVLLPPPAAHTLQQALLDRPRALSLLAGRYSANAHAHSLRYQNCNQWLVELMASAWGGLPAGEGGVPARARAQAWLAAQGYAPQGVHVGSHALMAAAPLLPFIHLDDHPEADRFALHLRTSLPADLEHFVRQREPAARRIELCRANGRVVLRQGWEPIAPGCVAQAGDQVFRITDGGAGAEPGHRTPTNRTPTNPTAISVANDGPNNAQHGAAHAADTPPPPPAPR